MVAFDPTLWRARAWARLQRASGTDAIRTAAAKRWACDTACIEALSLLVGWCDERGIEVKFCRRMGGIYYPENKRIKISGRLQPERQVFFLLHECGHHLIGDKEKHERFGMGYPQSDPDVKRTFRHRCDIVDEEFEAWHRGFKLAQRLNLRINKERFHRTRVEMLKTYIKWAAAPGGFSKDDDDDDEEVVA